MFFRPGAQQVHLAGDFNNWRLGEHVMKRNGDGYWRVEMSLPAGEFRFKYCADGEWFTDFAAFGVEPGRFGLDSIVRVPAATLTLAKPSTVREAVAA
jgi:1,4-alpha-glucan branching enzyme